MAITVPKGKLLTPGGMQGPPGAQGNPGVSIDSNNLARVGSDSLIYVPNNRFNSIGNPNFEIDQINCGSMVAAANTKVIDRWFPTKGGTMVISAGQMPAALPDIVVPGSNSRITQNFFRVILTTQQASLGVSDYINIYQYVEGTQWREFGSDAHSIAVLVRSSIAGLKFSISLRDSPSTKSLVKLCTIPTANVWTLIPLANILAFPAANFTSAPGSIGYLFGFCLAAGSNFTAPAADTWQAGNFLGAPGITNFAAQAVNSTFDIAFVQHEPGPNCSPLIDKPYIANLADCKRYWQKSLPYPIKFPETSGSYWMAFGNVIPAATTAVRGWGVKWEVEMAKVPTVVLASHQGVLNTVWIDGASAISATAAVTTTRGVGQITLNPAQAANASAIGEYSADTGW